MPRSLSATSEIEGLVVVGLQTDDLAVFLQGFQSATYGGALQVNVGQMRAQLLYQAHHWAAAFFVCGKQTQEVRLMLCD